jgi:hypothetical protein
MPGTVGVDSLNAVAAAAVVLFEAVRQRAAAGGPQHVGQRRVGHEQVDHVVDAVELAADRSGDEPVPAGAPASGDGAVMAGLARASWPCPPGAPVPSSPGALPTSLARSHAPPPPDHGPA